MNLRPALRIVRISALYDLVVTAGFALPFTAPALFASLGNLHETLGLHGVVPDPHNVMTVMFANLMGGLVLAWSVFRLVRPSLAAGVADSGGRSLFALGMGAALIGGATPIVVVMMALEIGWAVVQAVAVVAAWRRTRIAHSVAVA
ncbi:hypothetical protein [Frondihabitans cladoniiphilus]|uniref:Uncharacterized protein n=1 Tax=Frondihabitans cladoniiphilus TaxID=715785 RepID=A0ABP8VNY4_9MICO